MAERLLAGLLEALSSILDLVAAYPVEALALLAAWIGAEIIWRYAHPDPDRPRVKTRYVRKSKEAIEAAGKHTKNEHENFWPLPGGLLVAAEMLFVIGGSGTGKTLRILLYMIAYRLVQARRSIWMIDPKGELYRWTRRLLGFLAGHPLVYLISTLKGHADMPVSPINPMIEPEERLSFLRTCIPGTDGTKDTFFDNEAQRMSYRVAEAQIEERGGTDLVRVFRALDDPEELDRLAAAHRAMKSVWRGSDAQRGAHHDARVTALAALQALNLPRIARIFDTRAFETGTWDVSPTFAERTVGYLCIDAFDAETASGPVRAAVDHLMQRAAKAEQRGGPKVDAILEEAGTFGPLEKLNHYLNLLRGNGVNIAVVLQGIEQLRARLGRDGAGSALSAAGCLVVGQMTSPDGAEVIEQLAGTERAPSSPERPYLPLFAHALLAVPALLVAVVGFVADGLLGSDTSSGHPDASRNRERTRGGDGGNSARVLRFPRQHLYGFAHDPESRHGRLERVWAKVVLFWRGKWVMRKGQYLVLARGREPFLIDTRAHKQMFPLYGPRIFRQYVRRKKGGKLGWVRYQDPDAPADQKLPEEASSPPVESPEATTSGEAPEGWEVNGEGLSPEPEDYDGWVVGGFVPLDPDTPDADGSPGEIACGYCGDPDNEAGAEVCKTCQYDLTG